MRRWLPFLLIFLALAVPARADSLVVQTCGVLPLAYATGATRYDTVDTNGNKCISGNISTSVAGFTPAGSYATLTATGSSARVALPSGTVVVAYNTGTTPVSCVLGDGSIVAVANEDQIQPSGWFSYTVGANADIACIDQTGSTSNLVVVSGGTGIASGAGGGGGTLPAGAATAANQATEIASLATIATNTGAPVPLGTAGGWTPLKLAALSNTAVAIKASAGWLGKLYCYNPNSSVAYIQVYNVAAGSVTVGTTASLQSYGIPATNAAGFVMGIVGEQYGTAISIAATTAAGNGTAPSTAVDCNVSYN